MKKLSSSPWFLAGLLVFAGAFSSARATNYAGNGNAGFNGAVGNGTLSVVNNGSGGLTFSFTLGGGQANLSGNDIEIYVDNGKGGGIGTSTAALTDTADGGRQAASEYSGSNRSTLSFGTLMSPQFALDLSVSNANIFALMNNGGFGFNGGQTIGGNSQGGVTYTVTTTTVGSTNTTVLSANVPATDLGLSAFSGAALKFLAIQVSETGFSSNEATVGLTGNSGYGSTQTISAVNAFTAAVPEPRTWAMLAGGLGVLAVAQIRKSRAS